MANIKDYIPSVNSESQSLLSRMYINRDNSHSVRKCVGVDTLLFHVSPDQFMIRDIKAEFKRKPHNDWENDHPDWIKDRTGFRCSEKGLYRNIDGIAQIDVNPRGMSVKMNPSKLNHPYKLLRDEKKLKESFELVHRELKEIGITMNPLIDQSLSRVDLAKQFITDHDTSLYAAPVVKFTRCSFVRGKDKASYPDGFIMANKSFQLCGYAKRKEQIENAVESVYLAPERTYRPEMRAMNKRSVRSMYGITKGADLIECGFDYLNDRYQNQIKKRLKFPNRAQAKMIDIRGADIDLIREAIINAENTKGGTISQRFVIFYYMAITDQLPSIETIKEICQEQDMATAKMYRLLNELPHIFSQKTRYKKLTPFDLITELEYKLIG